MLEEEKEKEGRKDGRNKEEGGVVCCKTFY
jgi:hypothetical protein